MTRSGAEAERGLTGQAVRSFGWALLSLVGSRVIVLGLTLVLARILVPHEFGIAAAALLMISFFDAVLDLGVGAAVVFEQEVGATRRVHTAFVINVGVALALTALGVAAAPLACGFFQAEESVTMFRVMCAALAVRGLGQVHAALLRRDLKFGRRLVVDIVRVTTRAGIAIPVAVAGGGAWSIALGLVGGELASTCCLWMLADFRPRLDVDRAAARDILRFGAGFASTRVVNWLASSVDSLAAGSLLGPAALGVYNVAYRLPEVVISSVMYVFSAVAFPAYSKARMSGEEAVLKGMRRALMLTTLFAFPAGVGLAVCSRDIVLVLFGDRWLDAVEPMAIIALAQAVNSLGYASGDIFPATGRPGLLLKLSIPTTALFAVACLALAHVGLVGIALALLLAAVAGAGLRLAVAARVLNGSLRLDLARLWPATAASAGVVAGALPFRLGLEAGPTTLSLEILGGTVGCLVAVFVLARPAVGEVAALASHVRS